MRGAGPPLSHVALLLVLVVTSDCAAVGNNVNVTNSISNSNETLQLDPRPFAPGDGWYDDAHFTHLSTYMSTSQIVFPAMTLVSFEMTRFALGQMLYAKECDIDVKKTGVFFAIGKGLTNDIPTMTFPESIPVLVSSVGMNNETVKIVPYCEETLGREGFVAIMAMDTENVPNNDAVPLHHNSLLVAMDCEQFSEHVNGTMTPLTESLDVAIGERMDTNRAATFMFFDLNHDHDVNTKEYEYCPTKDYITVVPGGTCKHLWPHGLPDHQGPKAWLEEWLGDHAGIPKDEQPGPRVSLGLTGAVPVGHKVLALVAVLFIVGCSFVFTWTTLNNPHLTEGRTALSWWFMYPIDTPGATDFGIVLKLLSGPIILAITVGLRAVVQYYVRLFLQARAKQGHSRISTTSMMRLAWGLKLFMIGLALYLPPLLFYTAKNVINTKGHVIKTLGLVMSWINYELALTFFANNLIQAFNSYFQMAIPQIVDAMSGDVILGVTGLSAAVLDLVEVTRDGHGINDGCDLEELGNTFRILARDRPETFPAGAELSLFCTESDLNFTTVFNSTAEQLREMGVARFDDGNMCNLVCNLPAVEGRTPTSTFPIWCKDNGFSGARWTLSSLRGLLAPRLCPDPTQGTYSAPTNLATLVPIKPVAIADAAATSAGSSSSQTAVPANSGRQASPTTASAELHQGSPPAAEQQGKPAPPSPAVPRQGMAPAVKGGEEEAALPTAAGRASGEVRVIKAAVQAK